MKIAVSSDFFSKAHIEGIQRLAQVGFDAVELNCEWPHAVSEIFEEKNISRLLDLQDRHGVELLVHAPWYDLNAAAWNDRIRKETVRQYCECIRLAARIRSRLVVVHPGELSTLKMEKVEAISRSIRSIKECTAVAEQEGVIVGLENTGTGSRKLFSRAEDIRDLVRTVGSPQLGVVFDIAHAVLQGLDLKASIEVLAPHIEHIHVHDNFGREDEHLALGTGSIDYLPAFEALRKIGYDKTFTLEVESLHRDYTSNTILENRRWIMRNMGRADEDR